MSTTVSRREFMAGGVGVTGVTDPSSPLAIGERKRQAQTEEAEVLFQTDFEDTSPETYPNGWIKAGSRGQTVVDYDAAVSGNQVLAMLGKSGGCWEALSDRPLEMEDEDILEFTFHIQPTPEGSKGCHEYRGGATLRTATGHWDAGSGVRLFDCSVGGVFGGGSIVGPGGEHIADYSPGEWTEISVVYDRSSPSEIIQKYWVNGDHQATIRREPKSFEEDLSYLRLSSGDFLVLWDDIRVSTKSTGVVSSGGSSNSGGISVFHVIGGAIFWIFVFGLFQLYDGQSDTSWNSNDEITTEKSAKSYSADSEASSSTDSASSVSTHSSSEEDEIDDAGRVVNDDPERYQ